MSNKEKSELPIKHTPEPWYVVEIAGFYNIQDGEYYEDNDLLDEDRSPNAKANASRIVECVNALAGIEDPKKWVEEMKVNEKVWDDRVQMYEDTQDRNTRIYENLQAENEQLKHNYEVEYRDSGVYQNEVAKLKELISRVKPFINLDPEHYLMADIKQALKGGNNER